MNNSEPIGRFGTEWQRFMRENYPDIITAELVGEKFDELARIIDAERGKRGSCSVSSTLKRFPARKPLLK